MKKKSEILKSRNPFSALPCEQMNSKKRASDDKTKNIAGKLWNKLKAAEFPEETVNFYLVEELLKQIEFQ